jgi:hypothetical protein
MLATALLCAVDWCTTALNVAATPRQLWWCDFDWPAWHHQVRQHPGHACPACHPRPATRCSLPVVPVLPQQGCREARCVRACTMLVRHRSRVLWTGCSPLLPFLRVAGLLDTAAINPSFCVLRVPRPNETYFGILKCTRMWWDQIAIHLHVAPRADGHSTRQTTLLA